MVCSLRSSSYNCLEEVFFDGKWASIPRGGSAVVLSVMEFWATKPNLAQSRHRAPHHPGTTRVPSIISAVSARTTMGKQLQNISVFQQQQQYLQEI